MLKVTAGWGIMPTCSIFDQIPRYPRHGDSVLDVPLMICLCSPVCDVEKDALRSGGSFVKHF